MSINAFQPAWVPSVSASFSGLPAFTAAAHMLAGRAVRGVDLVIPIPGTST